MLWLWQGAWVLASMLVIQTNKDTSLKSLGKPKPSSFDKDNELGDIGGVPATELIS